MVTTGLCEETQTGAQTQNRGFMFNINRLSRHQAAPIAPARAHIKPRTRRARGPCAPRTVFGRGLSPRLIRRMTRRRSDLRHRGKPSAYGGTGPRKVRYAGPQSRRPRQSRQSPRHGLPRGARAAGQHANCNKSATSCEVSPRALCMHMYMYMHMYMCMLYMYAHVHEHVHVPRTAAARGLTAGARHRQSVTESRVANT